MRGALRHLLLPFGAQISVRHGKRAESSSVSAMWVGYCISQNICCVQCESCESNVSFDMIRSLNSSTALFQSYLDDTCISRVH